MYTVFQFKLILSFSVKVYTYVVSTITVGTLFQQHGHDVEEPLSCSDVKSCVSVIVCRRRLNTFLDQDAYTLSDATLHCLKKSLRLGRIRGKCPHNTTLQTARNYATKMPHKRRCKWVLIWHTVCASMWQLMVKHRIYGTGHATPSSVQSMCTILLNYETHFLYSMMLVVKITAIVDFFKLTLGSKPRLD